MKTPTQRQGTRNTPSNPDLRPASSWRGFALCYGAGLTLLLVTSGVLKLAFAALG
jgi:hypothetical protein